MNNTNFASVVPRFFSRQRSFLILIFLLLVSVGLSAQASPNDLCENAEVISGTNGIVINGTTVGAGSDGVIGSCAGSGSLTESGGVWYVLTGTAATQISVDLCDSPSDTRLGVFSGACDALIPVTGGDDSSKCGDDPALTVSVETGVSYYFYVTHAGGIADVFTLNITDANPPTAVCRDYTANLGGGGTAVVTAEDVNDGSTADFGIQSVDITAGTVSYTCSDAGSTFPVTLTVTDNNGDTGTCNATVTVTDAVAPTATVNDFTVTIPDGGSVTILSSDVVSGVADNCPGTPTIELSQETFTINDFGDNPITVSVTDDSGVTASYVTTVTVTGNTAPVAQCRDIEVEPSSGGGATVTAADIDDGSSGFFGIADLSITAGTTFFSCAQVGNTETLTLTATDNNGDSNVCTSTVTVADNTPPVITGGAYYLSVAEGATLTVNAADIVSASDNCGDVTLTATPNQFTDADTGFNSVTVTGTDSNGNSTTTATTVYINQNPNNTTAVCTSETINYTLSSDNEIIPSFFVDNGSFSNGTITSSEVITPIGCGDLGSTVPVTLVVTDDSGFTSSCEADVNVSAGFNTFDFSGFSLTNSSVYIEAGQSVSTASLFSGSVSSLCGGGVSLSYTPETISWNDAGDFNTFISVTATDAAGNSYSNSYSTGVTTNGPIARCNSLSVDVPTFISAGSVNNGSSATNGIASIYLEEGSVSLSCADAFTSGSVTLVVVDNNGFTDSCTSSYFADDPAPTVFANDVVLDIAAGQTVSLTAAMVGYSASDNCESVTGPTFTQTDFTSNDAGTNFISVCAETASGQTGCEFITVTVNTTAPVARCFSTYNVAIGEDGSGSLTVDNIDSGSSASSGISNRFLSGQTFYTCSDIGAAPQTVTLTVQDNNGATATCTTEVSAFDAVPPVVAVQDISIGIAPGATYTVMPSELYTSATDNCGAISSFAVNPNEFTNDDAGSNPVTLTVTTQGGQENYFYLNVYVNSPPQGNCPPTLNVPVETTVLASDVDIFAVAENGIASTSISPNDIMFTCEDIGTGAFATVTLTVTDNLGHVTTCMSNVYPADITPPVITANDITITVNAGSSRTITLEDLGAVITDDCGLSEDEFYQPSLTPSTFFASNEGANTVSIYAYDEVLNFGQTTVTVNVVVNNLPDAVCTDYTVNLDGSGNGAVTAANIDGGSSWPAGFGSMDISISQTSFTCADVGTVFPAVLNISDVNGATDNCSATVTIADNTAPFISGTNTSIYVAPGTSVTVAADEVTASVSDNCGVTGVALTPNTFTSDQAGNTYTVELTATDASGNTDSTPVQITVTGTPANEDCFSAELLPSGGFTGTFVGLNNEASAPPACDGSGDLNSIGGLWYYYNGDGNTVILDMCGTFGGGRAAVYTGDCGNLTCLAGGVVNPDNNCGTDAYLTFPTRPGIVYYVYLTGTTEGDFIVNADTTEPPVASCFPDYPVYLDAEGNANITAAQLDCDSEAPEGLASIEFAPETVSTFSCTDVGTPQTVELVVTDDLGQTSTCSSTITVIDNTVPVVVVDENQTITAEEGETYTFTGDDLVTSITDNCADEVVITVDPPSIAPPNEGTYPVIVTVTPPGGDPLEFPVTVTIINEPDLCGQAAEITCGQTIAGSNVGASAADEPDFCGDMNNAGAGGKGVWYTFIGTGEFVNFSSANSTYDTQIGIYTGSCDNLTCLTGNDDDFNSGIYSSSVTFESVSGQTYYIYLTSFNNSGFAPDEGDYELTCTCISDPVASCSNYTVELDAGGNGNVTVDNINNGSTAAAGIASVEITAGATDYTCADITPSVVSVDFVFPTVTLTITDNNGRTDDCTAEITVEDNIAPTVVTQNITIIVTGDPVTIQPSEVIVSVEDNCESEITYSISPNTFTTDDEGDNPVTLTVNPPGNDPIDFHVTVTVITIPSNNDCGEAEVISCSQTLTGTTEGATVTGAPAGCGLSGDLSGTAGVWYTFTGTGENVEFSAESTEINSRIAVYRGSCDGLVCEAGAGTTNEPVVTIGSEPGVIYYIYVTGDPGEEGSFTVSCNCFPQLPNDACANATMLSSEDNTYSGTTVGGNGTGAPADCGTYSNNPSAAGVWYTYEGDGTMVTISLCGSSGDTQAAVFEGDCDNLVCVDGEDDDSVNCDNFDFDPSVTFTAETGKNYFIYITHFGIDENDDFTFELVSIAPPNAQCQPYTCSLDESGSCTVTAENVNNGSTAEAGIFSIAITDGDLTYDCDDVGTPATVTLTVTDNNGDTGICTATVTIEDNIAPVVVPQDITINVLPDMPVTVETSQVIQIMSDNCAVATTELSISVFTQDNEGDNPITLTVTDVNGNLTAVPVNIFVINRFPLDIICRQPTSTCNAPDECGRGDIVLLPPHIPLDMELESLTHDAPDYYPVGVTQVVWTAVSTFGLVSECVSEVIIVDEQAPTVECSANKVVYTEPDLCNATFFAGAEMFDNCGIVTSSGIGMMTLPIGLHEHTFSATDAAGYTTTCTMSIQVHDITSPELVFVPEDFTVTAASGQTEIEVDLPEPVIIDACGVQLMLLTDNILPVGETTEIVWKGMDDYGNWIMASYNVTVIASQQTATGTDDSDDAEVEFRTYEGEETFILETSVYPNPANDFINLAIGEMTEEGVLTVTLTDYTGRIVEVRDYRGYGNERMTFDLSRLQTGLYTLHLIQAGEIIDIQRFVKN